MSSQSRTRQATSLIKRTYSKEELLGMVADGISQRQMAKFIGERTGTQLTSYYINRALKSYGEDYEEAKRLKAQFHASKASEIAEKVEEGVLDPASGRTSADIHRWFASKLDPRQYGDKIEARIEVMEVSQLHLAALKAYMAKASEAKVINALPRPAGGIRDGTDDPQ